MRPDTALRIVLTAIPHQLKGVVVSGASAFRSLDIHDFYGRMKDAERGINHGYFVTPEDIERRKPNWISQMADGLPTVRIRRGFRPQADVLISTNGCTMTVYLDGVRIVGRLNGRDDYINEMVSPGSVAAMEVYPRSVTAAEVPVTQWELRRGADLDEVTGIDPARARTADTAPWPATPGEACWYGDSAGRTGGSMQGSSGPHPAVA